MKVIKIIEGIKEYKYVNKKYKNKSCEIFFEHYKCKISFFYNNIFINFLLLIFYNKNNNSNNIKY